MMISASFSTTNIQTRINTLDKVKIEPINSQLLYTNFSRILVTTFEGGHLYHPHRLEIGFKKKRNPKWKEDVCLSSKSGTWSASGGLKGAIVEEGRVEIWGNRGEPERLETLASLRVLASFHIAQCRFCLTVEFSSNGSEDGGARERRR